MATTSKVNIVIEAKDNASKVLKKTGGAFQSFGDAVSRNRTELLGFTAAIGGVVGIGLKLASEMQQNRIAFETMLGSADVAREKLKELSEFARKTPFELPEVVTGAKQLLAYSIEADKLVPTFNALGNIAAGVGKDKLPNLVLAFGQVRAATKLTGMELRQFTEAGVPLLEMLAQQSGKTAAQIKEEMESGAAPSFEEVERAIFSMSQEGGKFFNLMEKQSQTFGGRLSNIMDNLGRLMRGVIGISEAGDIRQGSLFAVFATGADKFQSSLDKLVPIVVEFTKKIEDNRAVILAMAGAIGGLLVGSLGVLVVMFGEALLVIGTFIAIGVAAGAMIGKFSSKIGISKDSLLALWETIKSKLSPTIEMLREHFTDVWNRVRMMLPTVGQLTQAWKDMQPFVIALGKVFGTMLIVAIVGTVDVIMVLIGALANIPIVMAKVLNFVQGFVDKVVGFFHWLYMKLVGGSIIPDLINEIVDWFRGMPDKISSGLGTLFSKITSPFRKSFNWIKSQAEGVKGALQKLNPMHRESPSLVDKVKKGTDLIAQEFNKLNKQVEITPPRIRPTEREAQRITNNTFNVTGQMNSPQDMNAITEQLGMRVNMNPRF